MGRIGAVGITIDTLIDRFRRVLRLRHDLLLLHRHRLLRQYQRPLVPACAESRQREGGCNEHHETDGFVHVAEYIHCRAMAAAGLRCRRWRRFIRAPINAGAIARAAAAAATARCRRRPCWQRIAISPTAAARTRASVPQPASWSAWPATWPCD